MSDAEKAQMVAADLWIKAARKLQQEAEELES